MGDITYDSDRLKESYLSPGTHLINSLTSFLVPRTLFSLLKKKKYISTRGRGRADQDNILPLQFPYPLFVLRIIINYFL
jgi:hypothetical protein